MFTAYLVLLHANQLINKLLFTVFNTINVFRCLLSLLPHHIHGAGAASPPPPPPPLLGNSVTDTPHPGILTVSHIYLAV